MPSSPALRLTAVLLGTIAYCGNAFAEMQMDLTKGVTEISNLVYDVHFLMFAICTAIAVAVFGVMFYSILKHRKSQGHEAAQFHESTLVEVIWTIIPFIILIVMAVPATKALIAMDDTSNSELTVKITGSQWKWHYEYLSYEDQNDVDVGFFSLLSTPREQYDELAGEGAPKGENYLLEVDKPLVIPVNQKVRFLLTSDDVIHAWWVPEFAIKRDTVPGFINELWTIVPKTGIYRGQCAELCGKDHGFMPIVVEVKEQAEFKTWLAAQQDAKAEAEAAAAASLTKDLSMDELMAQGEQVYNARCAACHQVNGQGLPGVFPGLKDSPIAVGPVADHINIVKDGKAGTSMQAFGGQLTPSELASVITYERNAWENNTGDVVQPRDVQ